MKKRKLGTSGFEVAPLALGGNVFGWTADEAMSFRLLDAFVAGGFDLIDTADVYSRWVTGHQGGESETVIGRWIARRSNGLEKRNWPILNFRLRTRGCSRNCALTTSRRVPRPPAGNYLRRD